MLDWMYWTLETAIVIFLMLFMLVVLAILDSYRKSVPRRGFMRFPTTRGLRIFVSLLCMVAIGLLWSGFLYEVPMWGALATSAVVMYIIIKYG